MLALTATVHAFGDVEMHGRSGAAELPSKIGIVLSDLVRNGLHGLECFERQVVEAERKAIHVASLLFLPVLGTPQPPRVAGRSSSRAQPQARALARRGEHAHLTGRARG